MSPLETETPRSRRPFSRVTAIDYVPELLDRARRRAAADGLELELIEADAERIPEPDGSFVVVDGEHLEAMTTVQ